MNRKLVDNLSTSRRRVGHTAFKEKKMKLEGVQNALFAAYDLRNAMTAADKRRPTENAPFGESLDEVIEYLEQLEALLTELTEEK